MDLWRDLETGPKPPDIVNAVVEIPKGSRNKYRFEEVLVAPGRRETYLRLEKVLSSPVYYATDYGLIPRTLWDSGRPVTVLVLMEEPTHPGCVLEVRPVGLLKVMDEGTRDDKVLAVPARDPRFEEVGDLSDLPGHIPKEIAHFFTFYKALEGVRVDVLGWGPATDAKKAIIHSAKIYNEKFGPLAVQKEEEE